MCGRHLHRDQHSSSVNFSLLNTSYICKENQSSVTDLHRKFNCQLIYSFEANMGYKFDTLGDKLGQVT